MVRGVIRHVRYDEYAKDYSVLLLWTGWEAASSKQRPFRMVGPFEMRSGCFKQLGGLRVTQQLNVTATPRKDSSHPSVVVRVAPLSGLHGRNPDRPFRVSDFPALNSGTRMQRPPFGVIAPCVHGCCHAETGNATALNRRSCRRPLPTTHR